MSGSAWHQQVMADYYAAREAYELERERKTRGYAAELKEYAQAHPPYTFRRHLEGLKR